MSRGFLTFAQNNEKTDYLQLAYLQALSLKVTNQINQYAVAVDKHTMDNITDRHRRVFDHIILIPGEDDARDQKWKMGNEWKAGIISPFDETIKVESDILFTASIDHWWNSLSIKDVCFTNRVVNYTEQTATSRQYRKLFDLNNLPDIYAGLYYFKKSKTATELFDYARGIFQNWTYVKNYTLKNAENEPASTDVVFAMAVKFIGLENCTLPGPVPTFVHMKNAIQGWSDDLLWPELVNYEFDRNRFTIGFYRQRVPFHYNLKSFAKPEVISHYENLYGKTTV